MNEFFQTEFGKQLKGKVRKTNSIRYQGQAVYQVTERIPGTVLKKGMYVYLDALHMDHLEVFTKTKRACRVLNLDGSVNAKKTIDIVKKGRTV